MRSEIPRPTIESQYAMFDIDDMLGPKFPHVFSRAEFLLKETLSQHNHSPTSETKPQTRKYELQSFGR